MNEPKLAQEWTSKQRIANAHNQALSSLREEISANSDFMAFMTGELSQFECCCPGRNHAGTPPMMWPELIACIRKKEIEQATASLRADKERLEKALIQIAAHEIGYSDSDRSSTESYYRCSWCRAQRGDKPPEHKADCPVSIAHAAMKSKDSGETGAV